jgi:hypothetical protein
MIHWSYGKRLERRMSAAERWLARAERYTGSSWQILPRARVMSMTSMNVSLPEELKEYVEAQTKRLQHAR